MRYSVALISILISACQVARQIPSSEGNPREPHAWLEINSQAFESNILELKKRVGARVQICAVMKADAYGHGIQILIPYVVKHEIPCVGITSNEDARLVRNGNFKKRLLRLRTPSFEELKAGREYRIDELIGNEDLANRASQYFGSINETLDFHLALNSGGMSRNGIDLKRKSGREEVAQILKLAHLRAVGIMTHFPVEDVADIKKGLSEFKSDISWVFRNSDLDRSKVILSAANTFATLSVADSHYDMVRPGGALYGDVLSIFPEFKKVMEFKSRVATVNSYPRGNTVNYDRTHTLKRDSRLANIPVGYSDGYRRAFSNRAFVLIEGRRVPVLGRVTMNTIMADVTDFPDVTPGDEVVLFGTQGEEVISQQQIEKFSDTIYAELYTAWGKSNPRVEVRR